VLAARRGRLVENTRLKKIAGGQALDVAISKDLASAGP
jgi:hypothetical protein